jgi:hypothetical protein
VMIMTVTVRMMYVIVRMVTFVSLATPANGAHAYLSPNLLAFETRRMCRVVQRSITSKSIISVWHKS